MEYTIVEDVWVGTLYLEVQKMLDQGWVPCGGVCVACTDTGSVRHAYQAMTRPKEKK